MSRDHTIRGIRYYDCDLCGITYRITDTQLNSAGLRVCKDHDVDEGEYHRVVVETAAAMQVLANWYSHLATQGFWINISGFLDTFSIAAGGFE